MLAPLTRGIRSLLFPPACAGCGRPLESLEQEPLCLDCRSRLPVARPPWCRRCGLSLAQQGAGADLCVDCRLHPPAFDQAVSPFLYEGPVKELITGLKYRGRICLGRFLADSMARAVWEQADLRSVDAIVPVPLHAVRLRERGFNQAQILAAGLADRLGLPCRSDLMVRAQATQPQTELSREDRRENLRGAFAAGVSSLPGNSFILVDDVLTTGATVRACAEALRRAGATRILVVTAARG